MKRKIVQQGKSSLNISIPNAWAKKHGMTKGDEVNIEEKDTELIISTGKDAPLETKTLDVGDLDETSIRWYLISLYCSGFDELKIIFKDHEQIDSIHSCIRNLLGYNIMEQRKKYCIVRCISQPVEGELEPSLKRNFMVVLSIAESTLDAIRNKDTKAFNSVLTMEDTCNRITYFCLRLLNKRGYKSTAKTSYMYCLIGMLENISDAYGNMMKDILRKDLPMEVSDAVLGEFEEINKLLRTFYENFYRMESAKIHELAMKVHTEYDNVMELMKKADGTEQHILYYLNMIRNYIGESIVASMSVNL